MENLQLSRRNFLKNVGLVAVASLPFLSSCRHREEEYSQVLHEGAKVVKKEYLHEVNLALPPVHNSEQNLITFDGKIDFKVNNKEVYGRFNEGDTADITYREIYEIKHDNKNNLKNVLERKLVGYEFVDAQPEHNKK